MITTWFLALALAPETSQSPRSRPANLLQAESCVAGRAKSPDLVTELPSGPLVSLETLPPCLSDVMKRLQASANQLVSDPDATAVLQVGIGRAFSKAALMFSTPDDSQIHYVEDLNSITDILSSEWAGYVSPDGDLGWSGFVLVINKDGTKIRILSSPESPMGGYEASLQLEAEFFPGKKVDAAAGTLETNR